MRKQLINLIGSQNINFKSSATNSKINTTNPDSYSEVIRYLNIDSAEHHTYQARENKVLCIVIRNLHPFSPTSKVGAAIKNLGYSVHQITNIIHTSTKRLHQIFFFDLQPVQINNKLFKLTLLLHTKIKIEAPHKRQEII